MTAVICFLNFFNAKRHMNMLSKKVRGDSGRGLLCMFRPTARSIDQYWYVSAVSTQA